MMLPPAPQQSCVHASMRQGAVRRQSDDKRCPAYHAAMQSAVFPRRYGFIPAATMLGSTAARVSGTTSSKTADPQVENDLLHFRLWPRPEAGRVDERLLERGVPCRRAGTSSPHRAVRHV